MHGYARRQQWRVSRVAALLGRRPDGKSAHPGQRVSAKDRATGRCPQRIRLRRFTLTCRAPRRPRLADSPVPMAMRCHPGAMQRDSASHPVVPRWSTSARTKLLVSLGVAIVGGAAAAAVGAGRSAPLIGWDILASVFCTWVWSTVWRLDAKSTASHAQSENPGRDLADVVLLGAAVASLLAVGVVLFGAGHANGSLKYLQAGLALVSVSVSWTLVHTVFTLRYVRLYYSGRAGGIDFNEANPPAVQRLRLPVLHDRHDVPGLGHQHRIQADPSHGIAPRLAVVSAGGGR